MNLCLIRMKKEQEKCDEIRKGEIKIRETFFFLRRVSLFRSFKNLRDISEWMFIGI